MYLRGLDNPTMISVWVPAVRDSCLFIHLSNHLSFYLFLYLYVQTFSMVTAITVNTHVWTECINGGQKNILLFMC